LSDVFFLELSPSYGVEHLLAWDFSVCLPRVHVRKEGDGDTGRTWETARHGTARTAGTHTQREMEKGLVFRFRSGSGQERACGSFSFGGHIEKQVVVLFFFLECLSGTSHGNNESHFHFLFSSFVFVFIFCIFLLSSVLFQKPLTPLRTSLTSRQNFFFCFCAFILFFSSHFHCHSFRPLPPEEKPTFIP